MTLLGQWYEWPWAWYMSHDTEKSITTPFQYPDDKKSPDVEFHFGKTVICTHFRTTKNRREPMKKRVMVTVPTDTAIPGYGVLAAGRYLVEMPADYDPALVGAEDIVMDPAMAIIVDAE